MTTDIVRLRNADLTCMYLVVQLYCCLQFLYPCQVGQVHLQYQCSFIRRHFSGDIDKCYVYIVMCYFVIHVCINSSFCFMYFVCTTTSAKRTTTNTACPIWTTRTTITATTTTFSSFTCITHTCISNYDDGVVVDVDNILLGRTANNTQRF